MIDRVNGVLPLMEPQKIKKQQTEAVHNQSFANILKTTLHDISQLENNADKKTDLLIQGKIDNLHDVMITAEKAKVTVEAAVQVQQKVIDTYNEMMRMQL